MYGVGPVPVACWPGAPTGPCCCVCGGVGVVVVVVVNVDLERVELKETVVDYASQYLGGSYAQWIG